MSKTTNTTPKRSRRVRRKRAGDTKSTLQQLVDFARRHMFSAHRGAIAAHGLTFVFGNDGYGEDQFSQREVELLREALAANETKEVTFATDTEDGYTWGMLVEGDHEDWANDELWSFWNQAWIEDGSEASELEFVASVQKSWAFDEIEANRRQATSLLARLRCPSGDSTG